MRSLLARLPAFALLALLAACEAGPDYHRPAVTTPAAYKEAQTWQQAVPQAAQNRGPWWSVFQDPTLDRLERRVAISNQTLKADEAAYRQAAAIVAEAQAGYFPTLGLSGGAERSGQGTRSGVAAGGGRVQNQITLSANASWEPDLWGSIRRTVESEVANAQASAADLASAELSAQAAVASDYFSLASADEMKRLLDSTVADYRQSLQITRNTVAAGTASSADVAAAETQLETTRAQAIAVGVARAADEHAIAVLTGVPPAFFSLPPTPLATNMPMIPVGMPSTLLQRRPDVAAAERQMAAANAGIGVAEAAYYPNITLAASYGFAGAALGGLFQASNAVWSVGPELAATLFDGGLRHARVVAAQAGYDNAVATYRQTVLTAFEQVEDELAALRILAQEALVEDGAVAAAKTSERLTLNQYRAGIVAYTSVITAQTAALGDEETALNIRQSRLIAGVSLIEALGGGWNFSRLPDAAAIESGGAKAKP